ncbi:bifunctional phosphopantothenoylcysteine decarboxylase/phosphopantothenate--cysteine ligase CoaBC [Galactobacter sp.]|uniref:bifunctional phosphopantothenoylcysteine decarboxylase/phosphopantothenate--cysteine ligase CoaBC n=1 Tax=Galactobacter sp. TaxID=2676125 RepID=UPI0025C549BD|nr:bifunctional phosphopantothenoylcysteine decarboxylase/phosphopantothenate--cysteine ligase CoaBC [Galactobacter sp.]
MTIAPEPTVRRVVLGVAGGIAAYKATALVRGLKEAGHHVDVVPTDSALRFVGAPTWEALSGQPVHTSVFEAVDRVNHVALGQQADLVLVAPATADLLARAAAGRADDLLTATLLATKAQVVMAPAMHTEMWQHPATVTNVATLRSRGVIVLDPAVGRLTGPDSGPGRLPEPSDILAAVAPLLAAERSAGAGAPLAGRRVVVSAGGTREALDPVRYLGNRSSGKQGVALAVALRDLGADVDLIAANLEVPAPAGVRVTQVTSARDLETAVGHSAPGADALVMAAAVADFRPADVQDTKIKKRDDGEDPVITLVRNPDILAGAVRSRSEHEGDGPAWPGLIVGFAAETGDAEHSVVDYATAKLAKKGCELLVVNEVGLTRGFGRDENVVDVLSAAGDEPAHLEGSKVEVARGVAKIMAGLLT